MAMTSRLVLVSGLVTGMLAGASTASAQAFFDDFDAYGSGSSIAGQGGWEVWYTGGTDGLVSSDHAASGSNSLRLAAFSDIVHRFSATSGRWRFSTNVYIPSDATGGPREMFVILLNQYGGPDNWSVQTRFSLDDGVIESQFGGQTTGLTPDRWINFKAEIDLDTDNLDILIDDVLLVDDARWTTNTSGNGILEIAACDLYSNGIEGAYLDDVRLEEMGPAGCPADFNGDGFLDFFDYGDYVECFETGVCPPGRTADFNGDGFADFFDYGDFVGAFETGC